MKIIVCHEQKHTHNKYSWCCLSLFFFNPESTHKRRKWFRICPCKYWGLFYSKQMLPFLLFLQAVNESCWTDLKAHRNRGNTVSKSTKNLPKSLERKSKESSQACLGCISATSIPGGGTVEDPGPLLACEGWTMAPLWVESRSHAAAGSIRLPKLATFMSLFYNQSSPASPISLSLSLFCFQLPLSPSDPFNNHLSEWWVLSTPLLHHIPTQPDILQ